MDVKPRTIEHYGTAAGRYPFEDWMETLLDQKIYGVIVNRLERVKLGDLGDWAPVGEGVSELRIHMSPGFRIYFGHDGDKIILLNGGTKRTQRKDIRKAKEFWSDYNA